jgi:hypothetical protein
MNNEILYAEIRKIARKLEKAGYDEAVYLFRRILKTCEKQSSKISALTVSIMEQNKLIEEQYREIHYS